MYTVFLSALSQSIRIVSPLLILCSSSWAFAQETAPVSEAPVLESSAIDSLSESAADESFDDLSLKQLLEIFVETSSKKIENADFAPNTMYVISKDEIKKRGYHTLQEVLRIIPGFGVFQKDIQTTAQVRGIAPNDNEKISWLLNGSSISSIHPDLLNGPIDLVIAERIEIIVGPGSVLYGANSVLATVNIITRKAENTVVDVAIGNSTRVVTGIFGTTLDEKTHITATATVMTKEGWDAWPTVNDHGGTADTTNIDTTGRLDASYFLTLNAQMDNWRVFGSARNQTFPDLKHATSTPGQDGKRFERTNTFGFSNDHTFSDSFTGKFQVEYSDKRQLRVFTGGDPTQNGEDSYDFATSTYTGEYSLQHTTDVSYLQFGVQLNADQNRNNTTFAWAPQDPGYSDPAYNYIRPLVIMKDTFGIGVYGSAEYQVTDELKLVAAARVDKSSFDIDDTYITPRLAVMYSPLEMWATKVMYNQATRLPSTWEGPLNAVWGAGNPAAPSWASVNSVAERPEVMQTLEWQNILNTGSTRLTVSVYHQQLKDFISWGGPFTNVGKFEGSGAELSFKSILSQDLALWGNAAYEDSTFKVTANGTSFGNAVASDKGEMNAVPLVTANLGAEWDVTKNISVSPSIRYFTHQPTFFWTDVNSDPAIGNWGYSKNRYYVDLTITATDLLEGFDLSLQGVNLLNNTDTVAAQYLQGRYHERGTELLVQGTYRFK